MITMGTRGLCLTVIINMGQLLALMTFPGEDGLSLSDTVNQMNGYCHACEDTVLKRIR